MDASELRGGRLVLLCNSKLFGFSQGILEKYGVLACSQKGAICGLTSRSVVRFLSISNAYVISFLIIRCTFCSCNQFVAVTIKNQVSYNLGKLMRYGDADGKAWSIIRVGKRWPTGCRMSYDPIQLYIYRLHESNRVLQIIRTESNTGSWFSV